MQSPMVNRRLPLTVVSCRPLHVQLCFQQAVCPQTEPECLKCDDIGGRNVAQGDISTPPLDEVDLQCFRGRLENQLIYVYVRSQDVLYQAEPDFAVWTADPASAAFPRFQNDRAGARVEVTLDAGDPLTRRKQLRPGMILVSHLGKDFEVRREFADEPGLLLMIEVNGAIRHLYA